MAITFGMLGRYGRFSNGMYQICGTIGIAIRSGQSFGFPEWKNYDHLERFGSTEDIDVQKYFVNPLPTVDRSLSYESRFVHWGYSDTFLPVGNWDITGHLQSPKYFNHCMDAVRHYMTMKGEKELKNTCAIHFRAGDYIDDPNAYHPRCRKEYYEQALKYIPKETVLYVFSDDIDEAKRIMPSDREYLFAEEGDYIAQFNIMKSCTHFIISNSSYSAMAATLANQGGKIVVAPKKWFGDCAGISGSDIYEKDWIVI
jgi:hypothetical protein